MSEKLLREWVRSSLLLEVKLTASQLFKRDDAVAEYLRRIEAVPPVPFELAGGGEITIPADGNEKLIAALKMQDKDKARDAFNVAWRAGVLTSDGVKRSAGVIKKTQEFGGEKAGKRTSKETLQVSQINEAITKLGGRASADFGTRGGVASFVQCKQIETKGIGGKDPKADAVVLDEKGKIVGEISLKYARKPNQMQQWGGISDLFDTKRRITGEPTGPDEVDYVVEFIKDVQYLEEKMGRLDGSYYREIDDVATATKICYGDGGSLYNVGVIIASQTPIELDENGFVADEVWTYPQIPDGNWKPTLWARFSTGRGGHAGLRNVRLGILPRGARSGAPLPPRPAAQNQQSRFEDLSEAALRKIIRDVVSLKTEEET